MSHWHAPTASQLAWAAELGVQVPAGISRQHLSGLLRTVQLRQHRARLKELGVAQGRRFRRISDGVTYTIRSIGTTKFTVYNERARLVTQISFSSFFKFYELIE